MLKSKTKRGPVALLCAGLLFCSSGVCAGISLARAADAEFTVSTSSNIKSEDGSYHPSYLTDGNLNTSWLAAWQNETKPACDEWVLLDFGSVVKINSLTVFRHYDGTSFPADFEIQWSARGEVFETIAGFNMTDYAPAQGDFSGEQFRIRTVARYIRLHITKRSPNPEGYYVLAISELKAETQEATAAEVENAMKKDAEIVRRPVVDDEKLAATPTASSYNNSKDPSTGAAMWAVSHINDNDTSTQWCADWGSGIDSEECDEWITLTFPSPQYVTGMTIASQVEGHYGFPKNFGFEWTLDGENFFAVTGAQYEGESKEALLHVKAFSAPVVATAVRMRITACYPDTQNHYVTQLAELQAHGRAPSAQELDDATVAFSKLLGQAQEAKPKTRTHGFETQMTLLLSFAIAALCGAGALLALNLIAMKKNAKPAKEGKEETGND